MAGDNDFSPHEAFRSAGEGSDDSGMGLGGETGAVGRGSAPEHDATDFGFASPGSLPALRASNERLVVDAINQNGPLTQAQISRATGLSKATISNIVNRLAEKHIATIAPTTASGRRANRVSLTGSNAAALGVEITATTVRTVLVTIGFEVLGSAFFECPPQFSLEERLAKIKEMAYELIDSQRVSREAILGAGFSVPGPVDYPRRRLGGSYALPAWASPDMLQKLDSLFPWPAIAANDSTLGALAEVSWGCNRGLQNLAYIEVSTGIGAGMVINGQIVYGAHGMSGEIGHIIVDDHGTMCRCGNQGCVEAMSSAQAMIARMQVARPDITTVADFLELSQAGEVTVWRIIEQAAHGLGRVCAQLANIMDAEVFVIGGSMANLGPRFLSAIEQSFRAYVVPAIGSETDLQLTDLGEDNIALGAASLAMRVAKAV